MFEESAWSRINANSSDEKYTVIKLAQNSHYTFKVQGKCKVGCSPESTESKIITTTTKKCLADKMTDDSKLLSSKPDIFALPSSQSSTKRIRKIIVGKPNYTVPDKVIMLVGTHWREMQTLLNCMVNYLLNVQWEDPFRFKIAANKEDINGQAVDAEFSTEKCITAYTIYHQSGNIVDYNLTVVITPDCSKWHYQQVFEEFRDYIGNDDDKSLDYVKHVNAVCFVTTRLELNEKYLVDCILSMFGKDMVDKIMFLIMGCEKQLPAALNLIKKIPHKSTYMFPNLPLFADSAADDNGVDKMLWDIWIQSMTGFIKALNGFESKSLQLTREVLKQRKLLQKYVSEMKTLGTREIVGYRQRLWDEGKLKCFKTLREIALIPVSLFGQHDFDTLIKMDQQKKYRQHWIEAREQQINMNVLLGDIKCCII